MSELIWYCCFFCGCYTTGICHAEAVSYLLFLKTRFNTILSCTNCLYRATQRILWFLSFALLQVYSKHVLEIAFYRGVHSSHIAIPLSRYLLVHYLHVLRHVPLFPFFRRKIRCIGLGKQIRKWYPLRDLLHRLASHY